MRGCPSSHRRLPCMRFGAQKTDCPLFNDTHVIVAQVGVAPLRRRQQRHQSPPKRSRRSLMSSWKALRRLPRSRSSRRSEPSPSWASKKPRSWYDTVSSSIIQCTPPWDHPSLENVSPLWKNQGNDTLCTLPQVSNPVGGFCLQVTRVNGNRT